MRLGSVLWGVEVLLTLSKDWTTMKVTKRILSKRYVVGLPLNVSDYTPLISFIDFPFHFLFGIFWFHDYSLCLIQKYIFCMDRCKYINVFLFDPIWCWLLWPLDIPYPPLSHGPQFPFPQKIHKEKYIKTKTWYS